MAAEMKAPKRTHREDRAHSRRVRRRCADELGAHAAAPAWLDVAAALGQAIEELGRDPWGEVKRLPPASSRDDPQRAAGKRSQHWAAGG